MATIDPQEFGRLEARVERLLDADVETKALLTKVFARLDSIDRRMSEQRGGWKMLLAITGAAGSLGAGVGALMSHLIGKGPMS